MNCPLLLDCEVLLSQKAGGGIEPGNGEQASKKGESRRKRGRGLLLRTEELLKDNSLNVGAARVGGQGGASLQGIVSLEARGLGSLILGLQAVD